MSSVIVQGLLLFAFVCETAFLLEGCQGIPSQTALHDIAVFEIRKPDDAQSLDDLDEKERFENALDLSMMEHEGLTDTVGIPELEAHDHLEEEIMDVNEGGLEHSQGCVFSSDCPVGFYCLASRCVPWECVPQKKWCEEGNVVQCSLTGDSYEVVEVCDDGDPCTVGDRCENGRCVPGEAVDCDDSNPCTSDYCFLGTCEHSPVQGSCDDKNPCTTNDTCVDGYCLGEPRLCDDHNPCTDDFCDPLVGCKFLPNLALCDDMNPCTIGDMCSEGLCTGIDTFSCDDGDECTRDYCNRETGACEHHGICPPCSAHQDCDDYDMCTVDVCEKGYCRAYPSRLPPCCVEDADCLITYECSTVKCINHRCHLFSLDEASCCNRDVFFQDFSQGAGGFVIDPPVEGVGWQILSSNRCYSQEGCLYYGNPQSMSFDNSFRNSGTATTHPIRLPARAQVTLSFMLFMDCEATPNHDVLKVFALTENGRYLLWQKPTQFPMRQWNPVSIDISLLSGRFIRLELFFDTVDETNNTGIGVLVDDMKIVSTCRPKACTIPLDCHFQEYSFDCVNAQCDFGTAYAHTFSIGPDTGSEGRLLAPYGVAWSGGLIYVADKAQNTVFVFSLQGGKVEFTLSFGDSILKSPHGLRVLGSRIFVADTENNRVSVFTTNGVFVYAFGSGGESYTSLKQPKDLALTHDGGVVYVADTGNHRVAAFDPNGLFLLEFGEYGRKDGQFRSPSCIAVTSDYRVVVCDTVNQRLQVFTYDGQFISKIAFQGDFALDYPYGLLVLESSEIWISDTFHHRLIRANMDGRFLDFVGSYGSTLGYFNYPFSLAQSESQILVADSNNSRIVVIEKVLLP